MTSSCEAETLRKEREVFKAAHFEQIGPRMAGTITEEARSGCSGCSGWSLISMTFQSDLRDPFGQVLKKVLDGKTNKFYQEHAASPEMSFEISMISLIFDCIIFFK